IANPAAAAVDSNTAGRPRDQTPEFVDSAAAGLQVHPEIVEAAGGGALDRSEIGDRSCRAANIDTETAVTVDRRRRRAARSVGDFTAGEKRNPNGMRPGARDRAVIDRRPGRPGDHHAVSRTRAQRGGRATGTVRDGAAGAELNRG